MRERTDKSHPNAYSTAKSVMETIKNPLTEQQLLDFIAHNPYREGHENHHEQAPARQYNSLPPTQLQSRVH